MTRARNKINHMPSGVGGNKPTVKVTGIIKHITPKAFIFDQNGVTLPIPKSQVTRHTPITKGQMATLTMFKWLADKEGLIHE